MRIEADSVLPFPRERVFRAYRDELPAFTAYLPNVRAIEVKARKEQGPIVELHLSNPYAREPWRHSSVIAPVAKGSIVGFGGAGYRLAVEAVADLLEASA